MSDQMGRPKLTEEGMVLLQTRIPNDVDQALKVVAAEVGMSKASLVRTFLTTALQAYANTVVAMEQTPVTRPSRRGVRR